MKALYRDEVEGDGGEVEKKNADETLTMVLGLGLGKTRSSFFLSLSLLSFLSLEHTGKRKL